MNFTSERKIARHILAVSILLSAPFLASAQSPISRNVPAELVGDWSCAETRVYITRLGSIEILGESYEAGLFDANEGRLEIEWDEGARATWSYVTTEGPELALSDPDGETLNCIPRD